MVRVACWCMCIFNLVSSTQLLELCTLYCLASINSTELYFNFTSFSYTVIVYSSYMGLQSITSSSYDLAISYNVNILVSEPKREKSNSLIYLQSTHFQSSSSLMMGKWRQFWWNHLLHASHETIKFPSSERRQIGHISIIWTKVSSEVNRRFLLTTGNGVKYPLSRHIFRWCLISICWSTTEQGLILLTNRVQ